jgi:hypothetical protein
MEGNARAGGSAFYFISLIIRRWCTIGKTLTSTLKMPYRQAGTAHRVDRPGDFP